MTPPPGIAVSGLTLRYHAATVFEDLSFEVAPGRFVALLGPSGVGKSSLLKIIAGLLRPDAGTCLGSDGGRLKGRAAYMGQSDLLLPWASALDNIMLGARLRGEARDPARALALLERVGLAGRAAALPAALSGGMRQRVALARTLYEDRPIVLLDEPFSALDAALRAGTRRAVAAALAAAGATALLVTHDQSEALSMGDQVGVLRDGRLVQVAPPAELYRHPVDAALACFVGEAVLLDGVAQADIVTCTLGRLPLSRPVADGPARVMVRPEQIAIGPDGAAARVTAVAYYGHDASLGLVLADGTPASARIGGAQALGLQPGTEIRLVVTGPVVAFPGRNL